MICPDCCPDCPEETIDFNDFTFGSLTNTGTDPPWSAATGTLIYDGLGEASLLWTMPVTDDGTATTYRVSADVIGDSVSGIHGGAGGVIYRDATNDVTVTFAIVQGRLILRADWPDGIGYDDDDFPEVEADYRLTLQLSTVCEGRTLVRGWTGSAVSPGIILQFVAGFSIEDPTLPATVQLGVWVPTDSDEGEADLPFPECCPDDTKCYSGFTATGSLVNPEPPCESNNCAGRVEPLSLTTGAIDCSGSPLTISGFDDSVPYLIGGFPASTHPVSGVDAFFGNKLLVYCDGSIKWARLDSDGCFIEGGSLSGVTCDPFGGYVEGWASETADCCDGFGAEAWRIEVAGVVTPCAGDADREFDNVTMSACGGAPIVECPTPPDSSGCWVCPPRSWELVVPAVPEICPDLHGTWTLYPDHEFLPFQNQVALFYRSAQFPVTDNGIWEWRATCFQGELSVTALNVRDHVFCGVGANSQRWCEHSGNECPFDEETVITLRACETGPGNCGCAADILNPDADVTITPNL